MDRCRRSKGRGRDNRPAWLVEQERQEHDNNNNNKTKPTIASDSPNDDERPPPPKRQRVELETVVVAQEQQPQQNHTDETMLDDVDDDEELLLLQATMDENNNDNFVSQEDREAKAARQRRLKRKQRLQKQQQQAPVFKEAKGDAQDETRTEEISSNNSNGEAVNKEENGDIVDHPIGSSSTGAAVDTAPTTKEDDDDFDMFSSSVSPVVVVKEKPTAAGSTRDDNNAAVKHHHQQDWDDEEGYYKATIGEVIDLSSSSNSSSTDQKNHYKFRVQGIVGKGVFSTVLKCETLQQQQQQDNNNNFPPVTALKLIRHNDTMAKAALDEIRFLQSLQNCNGIVQLYLPTSKGKILEHRGHTCLVFDYFPYNLRHVLRKFGRGVGLSLTGVRAYFVQLLAALQHLESHKIIHADLKPDNVLVSSDFGTVQLCDFGSAFGVGSDNIPTPYLVSRFYRAPEVILGLLPTPAVDLWSIAATVGELFLGTVLFHGNSNNDMLLQFMERLGPFSNRTLRQHLRVCQKHAIPQQFDKISGGTFLFLHQTSDKVTAQPVSVTKSLQNFPKKPLQQLLLQAKSAGDSRIQLLQLSQLLQKCLALDPTRRIALTDALRHDFFQTKQQQQQQDADQQEQATTTSGES